MRSRSLFLTAKSFGLRALHGPALPSVAHVWPRSQIMRPFHIAAREFSGSEVEVDEEGRVAVPPLQPSWSWVPPREADSTTTEESSIPVIKKQLLSMEEITEAIKKLGGENVVIVELVDKIDTITQCVIATGNSRRHLRKMADVIVAALKERELRLAPGHTGAEGADDDDWLLVDCYDSAVHFMLAETREALKLEEHLLMKDKPYPKYSRNEEEYEKEMERLLEQYPIPENYNVIVDTPNQANSDATAVSRPKGATSTKKSSGY